MHGYRVEKSWIATNFLPIEIFTLMIFWILQSEEVTLLCQIKGGGTNKKGGSSLKSVIIRLAGINDDAPT